MGGTNSKRRYFTAHINVFFKLCSFVFKHFAEYALWRFRAEKLQQYHRSPKIRTSKSYHGRRYLSVVLAHAHPP